MSHHASNLTEGMREGDLADLVLPLMSIDEYESKVDRDEAIVFGFYVHEKAAAVDLNRFMQKSAVSILDTEVSPAPDQHGYFMVFVELLKNKRLAQNVSDILSEIKVLVDIEDWQMRVRDSKGLTPFSERNLTRALDRKEQQGKANDVMEFLRPSALNGAVIEDGLLILEGSGERHVFELVKLDRLTNLISNDSGPISLTMKAVAQTNRIRRMLGEAWDATMVGPFMLLRHDDDPRGLLVRV